MEFRWPLAGGGDAMAAVVGVEVVTTPCMRLSKEYLILRNEEEGVDRHA